MSNECNCTNTPCDCREPVIPGSGLALSAATSQIASARIDRGAARALARFCATNNCTQSSVLRQFVSTLAKSAGDPEAVLAAVYTALDLEPDAGRPAINAALDALFAVVGDGTPAGGADPLAGAADAPPPANPLAATRGSVAQQIAKLSKDTLAQIKAKGLTPAQFIAKRNAATHRST